MYNKNKWLAGFNAVIFVMEIIVMLVVYNVGIHSGTSERSPVAACDLISIYFPTALATPEGLTGCYGITTNYLFSIWIPGTCLTMPLSLPTVLKHVFRPHLRAVARLPRLVQGMGAIACWHHRQRYES